MEEGEESERKKKIKKSPWRRRVSLALDLPC
jgi:hypothetical protein